MSILKFGTLVAAATVAVAGAASADEPSIPGSCPGADAGAMRAALARSDAGEGPVADLDLAACYRALGQPFPESVALARALRSGLLPDADAAAARARLDEIGHPPDSDRWIAAAPTGRDAAPTRPAAEAGAEGDSDAVWAYVLAGLAGAGLLAGTVSGFVALDHEASGEDAVPAGVAGAVLAAIGIAAGVAAVVLWPDGEVAPGPGPGDVGLGLAVRF
ncbi:MAG: hypothetical protein QME96_08100 [Myxococcota bacterium]|nr:hypothetical protein [Myxococcota bacterium]